MNLQVIRGLIPFPVVVQSALVRELRVHVPWTRLTSESILVTLHTVECVLVPNHDNKEAPPSAPVDPNRNPPAAGQHLPSAERDIDSGYATEASNASRGVAQSAPTSQQAALTSSQGEAAGKTGRLSSSYLQAYLARLLNNVCFRVENLVIKFLDGESHALTLNLQSLDLYSSDASWNRAYVTETGSVRSPSQAQANSTQTKSNSKSPPSSATTSTTASSKNWILHKVAHLRNLNVCLDALTPSNAASSPAGPSPGSAVRAGREQNSKGASSQSAHARAQSPMSGAEKERLLESFQPPLLYRFNLECRMQMETGTADGIRLTHLSFLVRDQLELSMTRTQLVGLLKLMDVALELYYASASDALLDVTPTLTESDLVLIDTYSRPEDGSSGQRSSGDGGPDADADARALLPLLNSRQSWSEWAWSYVWPLDMEPPAPDASLLPDEAALLAVEGDSSASAVPDVAPQLSILVCDVVVPKFSVVFKTIDYRPVAQKPASAPAPTQAPTETPPAGVEGTAAKSSESQVKAFGRGTEIPVSPALATEAGAERQKARRVTATPRFRKFLEFQMTGVSCTVRREGDSFLDSQFAALDMHLLTSGACTCFDESGASALTSAHQRPNAFLRCPPLLRDLPEPVSNRLLSIAHPEPSSALLSATGGGSLLAVSLPESLFCDSSSAANGLRDLYSSVRSQATVASAQTQTSPSLSQASGTAVPNAVARCTTLDEHLTLFDERWPRARGKALWMDFTSAVERPEVAAGLDSESQSDAGASPSVAEQLQQLPQEATLMRCVLQDTTSELSVGALHRLVHLSEALTDYWNARRRALCPPAPGSGVAARALPFAPSPENLERFLPLKRAHYTISSVSLSFQPGDVLGLEKLPLLKASYGAISAHATKPMYPSRVRLVLDSLPGPLDHIAHLTYRSYTSDVCYSNRLAIRCLLQRRVLRTRMNKEYFY